MSANNDKFEQELKKAYQIGKQQNSLTPQQIKQFKSLCTTPKKSTHSFWYRAQWTLACAGLFILTALWFIPTKEATPLYGLDLNQYEVIEQHALKQDKYTHTIKHTKAPSLARHTLLLNQARSFHGRVIESNEQRWLVEDCQKNTLLEIEHTLITQVGNFNLTNTLPTGTLIAFDSNQKGQLINIAMLPEQARLLSCP